MIFLLTPEPIKANKGSVRWIPMSRKPCLKKQISKEFCFGRSCERIAVLLDRQNRQEEAEVGQSSSLGSRIVQKCLDKINLLLLTETDPGKGKKRQRVPAEALAG